MRFDVDEVEAAVESGAERIVVAGGDGSIAPVAAAAGAAGIPLAVVPAGTANDFARRIGLPGRPHGRVQPRGARDGPALRWSWAG